MSKEIAIIGAGMHPWGKFGKNFVEYGVVAARAALADAGIHWRDVQFVSAPRPCVVDIPATSPARPSARRLAGRAPR